MAGLFYANFRSAHEPERTELLRMILLEAKGSVQRDEFVDYIYQRDERLGLEFDSSWVNYFIIGHLMHAFPDAKFILLVRDCYTWVESIVNHMLTREIPTDVREFMDWWFEPQKYPHRNEELPLKENGLFSLECYLTAWRSHVTKVSGIVPPDRLLIIRTHEIRDTLDSVTEFLRVPREGLDDAKCHLNKGTREKQITSLVDRRFLEDVVAETCNEMMCRHFPEVKCIDQAYGLWGYQD